MKHITALFLLIIIALVCNQRGNKQEEETTTSLSNPSNITLNLSDSLFQTEAGWGYMIKMNDKPYIHQPHIPSVGGNQGFSTKAKAQKAVEFVKYKIQNNIMPPSVSPEELDSLGVL